MGSKQSSHFQRNRPESGGTDQDEKVEKSGILEREKQEFAASRKALDEKDAHGGEVRSESEDARSDD